MMRLARIDRAVLLLLAAAVSVVPVTAEAADGQRTVYVPRLVVYPGDVITSDDLMERKVLRTSESEAVFGEDPQDLVGKVARRTLLPGDLVPSSAVRAKDIVVQGRPYKLAYKSEFVSIVGIGVPLQSGSAGETVSVRNPDTGLIIKARIEADQTLVVDQQ